MLSVAKSYFDLSNIDTKIPSQFKDEEEQIKVATNEVRNKIRNIINTTKWWFGVSLER